MNNKYMQNQKLAHILLQQIVSINVIDPFAMS